MWKNPVYRRATVIGGALLLGVAALSVAGAAGGGSIAGDVIRTLRVNDSSDGPLVASPTPTPARSPESTSPPAKVAAANPDGHCVMLPVTSDIIEHPTKHPDWHVMGGECPTPSPTPTGSPASPTASPGARTAATNPDGHCVMLPDTSDIIRQPEKHPEWHILGGSCPSSSPKGK